MNTYILWLAPPVNDNRLGVITNPTMNPTAEKLTPHLRCRKFSSRHRVWP